MTSFWVHIEGLVTRLDGSLKINPASVCPVEMAVGS